MERAVAFLRLSAFSLTLLSLSPLAQAWSGNWPMDNSPAVGDFDGDGKLDLYLQAGSPTSDHELIPGDTSKPIVTRANSNSLSLGEGARALVADLNADGKAELLFQRNAGVSHWLANPMALDWASLATRTMPDALLSRDEERAWVGNFDGLPGDEVLAQALVAGQPNRLFVGHPAGGLLLQSTWADFNPANSYADYQVAAGDFDHNGRQDLFWHNTRTGATGVVLLESGGKARSSSFINIPLTEPQLLAMVDVDGVVRPRSLPMVPPAGVWSQRAI